jgi:hypothetical protein
MNLKKTKIYYTLEIAIGVFTILLCAAIFILLKLEIFSLESNGTPSDGLGKAFALVFYIFFMIVQCIFSIVMIIEGVTVKTAVSKFKNINPLIIIIGIIKIAVVAGAVLMASILFGVWLWLFGAACAVYGAVIIFSTVFGFVCTKEIKASALANKQNLYPQNQ